MNRFCWWLSNLVSTSLEAGERQAVLGDLAESGASGAEALRDVLDLVLRRQAALWWDWRPWLVLATLVVPIGVLLNLRAAAIARVYESVMHFSMAPPIVDWFLLISWSWSAGFALASIARRTAGVNRTVFCVVLTCSALWTAAWGPYGRAVVNAILSTSFQVLLVLVPSLWGMRRGLRMAVPPLVLTVLWALAFAAELVIQMWFSWPWTLNWSMRLALLAEYWPAVYTFAMLSRRRLIKSTPPQ